MISVWGAAVVVGQYSRTRVYILGLTYATRAMAQAAGESLIAHVQALQRAEASAPTAEGEWVAAAEIDKLLGEPPDPRQHSSYAGLTDWRVQTAEFKIPDAFSPVNFGVLWRVR